MIVECDRPGNHIVVVILGTDFADVAQGFKCRTAGRRTRSHDQVGLDEVNQQVGTCLQRDVVVAGRVDVIIDNNGGLDLGGGQLAAGKHFNVAIFGHHALKVDGIRFLQVDATGATYRCVDGIGHDVERGGRAADSRFGINLQCSRLDRGTRIGGDLRSIQVHGAAGSDVGLGQVQVAFDRQANPFGGGVGSFGPTDKAGECEARVLADIDLLEGANFKAVGVERGSLFDVDITTGDRLHLRLVVAGRHALFRASPSITLGDRVVVPRYVVVFVRAFTDRVAIVIRGGDVNQRGGGGNLFIDLQPGSLVINGTGAVPGSAGNNTHVGDVATTV